MGFGGLNIFVSGVHESKFEAAYERLDMPPVLHQEELLHHLADEGGLADGKPGHVEGELTVMTDVLDASADFTSDVKQSKHVKQESHSGQVQVMYRLELG